MFSHGRLHPQSTSVFALASAMTFLVGVGSARAQSDDAGWDVGEGTSTSTESDEAREVPPPPPPKGAEDLSEDANDTSPQVFEPEEVEDAGEPQAKSDDTDGVDPRDAEPAEATSEEAADADEEEPEPAKRPYTGPPTLFQGRVAFGGYGGIDVRWSRVAGNDAVFVGGEGALLLNHRLAIGIGGYGLANLVDGPVSSRGNPSYLGFGYGGLVVRHNFVNQRLVYLSVGTLVGAGGVGFFEETAEYEYEYDYRNEFDEDPFFVVEPSIGLHLNVTRWMRVGATVSYRYTEGIDCEGFTDEDFRGPSVGGQVQFGWF